MIVYAYCKNGSVVDIGPLTDLTERYRLPPLAELTTRHLSGAFQYWQLRDGRKSAEAYLNLSIVSEEMKSEIERACHAYGKFGPWGDLIALLVEETVSILWIAQLEYHKPGLATDLVVFVEDAAGSTYYVGIRRKNEPGKGTLAPIGGFLEVDRDCLDSPLDTILHEARDEAGIHLMPDESTRIAEEELLSTKIHAVHAFFAGNGPYDGKFQYAGVVPTSNDHNLPNGMKRVYWTFIYVLFVRLPILVLSEEDLVTIFLAGDDASDVLARRVVDDESVLQIEREFVVGHHRQVFAIGYAKQKELRK